MHKGRNIGNENVRMYVDGELHGDYNCSMLITTFSLAKIFCGFHEFLMDCKSFSNKCSGKQWLSSVLSIQIKQKS